MKKKERRNGQVYQLDTARKMARVTQLQVIVLQPPTFGMEIEGNSRDLLE